MSNDKDSTSVEPQVEPSRILALLKSYRCSETLDSDGDGLPLVDKLTPEGDKDISRGRRELESLAEFLAADSVSHPPLEQEAREWLLSKTTLNPDYRPDRFGTEMNMAELLAAFVRERSKRA